MTSPIRVIFVEGVADVTVVELLTSHAAGRHTARGPSLNGSSEKLLVMQTFQYYRFRENDYRDHENQTNFKYFHREK